MFFRLILIFALAVGGLAVYFLTNIYLTSVEQQTARQIREENDLRNVLVFARDLQRGTKLSPSDLVWQERKKDTIPALAYVNETTPDAVNSLVNSVVARGVSKGELVLPDIILSTSAGFMALAIRPGMRAIAIRTSTVQIAGGFVQPEDRIDVIHTVVRDLDGDGIANGISETILSDVRVLAVGGIPTDRTVAKTVDQQQENKQLTGSKPIPAETITLELTDEQARLLIAAGTNGAITFALRPIGNPTNLPQTGKLTTLATETTGTAAAPTPQPVQTTPTVAAPAPTSQVPQPPQTTRSVRVISPTQQTVVQFPAETRQ